MYTIYLITCLVNEKVYVGQTRMLLERRWYFHTRDAKATGRMIVSRAIQKYGPAAFMIRPVQFAETQEQADFLEEAWVFLYNSRNPKIGYNVRPGGASSRQPHGTKMLLSAATKKSWSEGRLTGQPCAEETRKKISKTLLDKGDLRPDVLAEEILFLWNNEVSVKALAKHFSVSGETIRARIHKSGLPYRPFDVRLNRDKSTYGPKANLDFDVEAAQKLRDEGLSYEKIAQRLCNEYTGNFVSRKLKALKLLRE